MNWGKGILMVFVAFTVLIITLVYKSSKTKVDLVSKDYYEQELLYQHKIDGMKNANLLANNIEFSQDNNSVTLQMPDEMNGKGINGEIWFYYPPDATKDMKILLAVNGSGRQEIRKELLTKGSYTVKVSWESGAKKYYAARFLKVD